MERIVFCPICLASAKKDDPQTPNGGELFIAEEMRNVTECYAPNIVGYTCSVDKNHMFYIVVD